MRTREIVVPTTLWGRSVLLNAPNAGLHIYGIERVLRVASTEGTR